MASNTSGMTDGNGHGAAFKDSTGAFATHQMDSNGNVQVLDGTRGFVPLWAWLFNCDAGTVTLSGYFTNHATGQVGAEWTATVAANTPIDFQTLWNQNNTGSINWSVVDGFEGVLTMNGSAARLWYAKNNTYNGSTITDGSVTHWSYLPYYSAGTLLIGRVSS